MTARAPLDPARIAQLRELAMSYPGGVSGGHLVTEFLDLLDDCEREKARADAAEATVHRLRRHYRIQLADAVEAGLDEEHIAAWLSAHGWARSTEPMQPRQWRRADFELGLGICFLGPFGGCGPADLHETIRDIASHHRVPELEMLERIAAWKPA